MTPAYTEDALIEQPAIALFAELGWETANCYHEFEGGRRIGRETSGDVVLVDRLRTALERLNPDAPAEAIGQAIDELARDRSAMNDVAANRELYKLIKDGAQTSPLPMGEEPGNDGTSTLRVIDWNPPANNGFFLASQLWVTGDLYKRRADLVGFVNGLPLVFIELKASHRRLRYAFDDNLRDYRDTIPHLLTRPDLSLTKAEVRRVKKVARDLLKTLVDEKLTLDWRMKQQSRAAVQVAIAGMLEALPERYSIDIYQHKCDQVYQHVYESYSGAGQSEYASQ